MLRELREKKNLTQTQLSFLSGVSIKTISRIENGDECIQYQSVKKLAEFLETDVQTVMSNNERVKKGV